MKRIIFLILLISFSLQMGLLKRSRRSKHGEDCISDSACEEGLICKIIRCYTKYESSNLEPLGLLETNLCSFKKKCPIDKKCLNHRCIDKNSTIEQPKNRTGIIEDVSLVFSGSIFLTKKPYTSGIKPNQTYNYDHLFTHISKYIKAADLAIVPLPSIFNDFEKKAKHKGIPKELGDAIVNAGFKLILHASPNAYSHKEKGINNTINFWKNKHPDVHYLGISSNYNESQNDYFIYNKNNIKIGIINYSCFLGKSIPSKSKFMVNLISKKKVEDLIPKLKKEVDFIIVCINWGDKYSLKPNKNEINWARTLAGLGVNLIIGNNPAYVLPVAFVKANNGKSSLVFFSLGVLIGENYKKPSSLGALANIVISKENGKTHISSYNLIPTINHISDSNQYSVYKLTEYNETLGKSVNNYFSMEKTKKICRGIMGAFAHCG